MKLKDNLKTFSKYVAKVLNTFSDKFNKDKESFIKDKINEYDSEFASFYEEKKNEINELHKEVNDLEQKIWRTALNDIVIYKPQKAAIYNDEKSLKRYDLLDFTSKDEYIEYGFDAAPYTDGYYPYGRKRDNFKVSTNLEKERINVPLFHLDSNYSDSTLKNIESKKWFQYIDDKDRIVDNTLKQYTRLVPGYANIHSAGFPNVNFTYGKNNVGCSVNVIYLNYDNRIFSNGVTRKYRLYNEFEITSNGNYSDISLISSDEDYFTVESLSGWVEVKNTKGEILYYSKKYSCKGNIESDFEISGYIKVFSKNNENNVYLIIPIKQEAYDSYIGFNSATREVQKEGPNGTIIKIQEEVEDLPEGWERHEIYTGVDSDVISLGYGKSETSTSQESLTLTLSSSDDDDIIGVDYISSNNCTVSFNNTGKEITITFKSSVVSSSTVTSGAIVCLYPCYNNRKCRCACPVYIKYGNFGNVVFNDNIMTYDVNVGLPNYVKHEYEDATFNNTTKVLSIPSRTTAPFYTYGFGLETNKLTIIRQRPESDNEGIDRRFIMEDASPYLDDTLDIAALDNQGVINKFLTIEDVIDNQGNLTGEKKYPTTITLDGIIVSDDAIQTNDLLSWNEVFSQYPIEIINLTEGVSISKNVNNFIEHVRNYEQDVDVGEEEDIWFAAKYKLNFDVNLDSFTEESDKFYAPCESYVIFNNSLDNVYNKNGEEKHLKIPNYEIVKISVSRKPEMGTILNWMYRDEFVLEIGNNLSSDKSYVLEIRGETNSNTGFIGMSSEISNSTVLPSIEDKIGIEVLDSNENTDILVNNKLIFDVSKRFSSIKINKFRYYTKKKRKKKIKRVFVYYKVNFNSPEESFVFTEGKTQQDVNYLMVDKISDGKNINSLSSYINKNNKLKLNILIGKMSSYINMQSLVFKLYEKY